MNKSVVRVGDYCVEVTPHFCISGSYNVFVNGKPMCRQGDSLSEVRALTEGSKTVFFKWSWYRKSRIYSFMWV